jgi:hypothetical protein
MLIILAFFIAVFYNSTSEFILSVMGHVCMYVFSITIILYTLRFWPISGHNFGISQGGTEGKLRVGAKSEFSRSVTNPAAAFCKELIYSV